MRNIFDQYSQPENRLTHALAVCLHEDRRLLGAFLRHLRVKSAAPGSRLIIVEQQLPGDPPESEEVALRKGLPDIVIHDDVAWAMLIESKVQSALSANQLIRHERTLRARGFERIDSVALTKCGVRAPKGVTTLFWSELYEWLGSAKVQGDWPERLRSYLRAAEVRLSREGYLTEGTLTMFDGFPFNTDNPYTYGEAKRLLKLAMIELRKDRKLRSLGMDASASGRSAITGRSGSAVWDFLSLRERPRRGAFTRYPHLTLAVAEDGVEAAITIPNGVRRSVLQNLRALGHDEFVSLHTAILRRAKSVLSRGGFVMAYAAQRHYKSQRSMGIRDARMDFKLETSLPRQLGKVKRQPEWLNLFSMLLAHKRSNIQFGYAIKLPWGTKGLDQRESLELISKSWCAMKPLLDIIRDK